VMSFSGRGISSRGRTSSNGTVKTGSSTHHA
jgi:hypothetical protein